MDALFNSSDHRNVRTHFLCFVKAPDLVAIAKTGRVGREAIACYQKERPTDYQRQRKAYLLTKHKPSELLPYFNWPF